MIATECFEPRGRIFLSLPKLFISNFRMASNMHVAFFYLAIILPRSCLQGIVIVSCILMLLIPLRGLWCQSSRLPSRRIYSVRLSKEQKRRMRQRHQRAVWLRDRRERQRLHRDIWKLTRRLCMSMHGVTSVGGSDGHHDNSDPVQKASTPSAKLTNSVRSSQNLSSCAQHHVALADQYSGICAQSTPVFPDDQQISPKASMPCAPQRQACARCNDGAAATCSEVHASTANQYSTPCAHSTSAYAGVQQISHMVSMPCAQSTQGFAQSIDGDVGAYMPDALIAPGSSHFDFHILIDQKVFFFWICE